MVRSYVDWGVLLDESGKGLYSMAPPIVITEESVAAWLIEGTLRSGGSEAVPLKILINSPLIFPFKIRVLPTSKLTGRVEVHRQGLDEDMLILKKVR